MSDQAETPPLSDEYHKARRNLVFSSSILLVWEFIGISVGKAAKLPAVDVPVTIRNPDVIPICLFAMVLFFGSRLLIEWKQNSENRRSTTASVADITISYFLALTALSIYVFQIVSGIDVATEINQEKIVSYAPIILILVIDYFFTAYSYNVEYKGILSTPKRSGKINSFLQIVVLSILCYLNWDQLMKVDIYTLSITCLFSILTIFSTYRSLFITQLLIAFWQSPRRG